MIEVGEYYRTESGYIDKIRNIDKQGNVFKDEKGKLQLWLGETIFGDPYSEEITKHSKDIIDLIEVGDYVNEMRVIATENRGRYNEEKQKDEKVILAENYDEWTENGVISNEEIKTILTHEMYEQNCYKVGED